MTGEKGLFWTASLYPTAPIETANGVSVTSSRRHHDPGVCSSWEGGSGANACFVTEPEQLTDSLSPTPPDAPPLEREARIVEWLERDDGKADPITAMVQTLETAELPTYSCAVRLPAHQMVGFSGNADPVVWRS